MKTVASKLILTVVCRINQRHESLEAERLVGRLLAMIQAGNDKNPTRMVSVATGRKTGTRAALGRKRRNEPLLSGRPGS